MRGVAETAKLVGMGEPALVKMIANWGEGGGGGEHLVVEEGGEVRDGGEGVEVLLVGLNTIRWMTES